MSKYTPPAWSRKLYEFVGYMTEDFGGGPKRLKMAWVINFHKIFTLFIIAGVMTYLGNFSTTAWVYLGLHGIYGYCWLVKDGSISRYPEWDAYAAGSSRLVPWRILTAPFQKTQPESPQASP